MVSLRGEHWAKGRSCAFCTLGCPLWNWLDRDSHDRLIRCQSHLDGIMSMSIMPNELRRLRRRHHRVAAPQATSAEPSLCADEAQGTDEA